MIRFSRRYGKLHKMEFLQRNGKKYYLANEKYISLVFFLNTWYALKMNLVEEAPGYVWDQNANDLEKQIWIIMSK